MDGSVPLGDHLAAMFGGGPERTEAYQEGRYTRARTEDALAKARLNRDISIARTRLAGQDFAEINPMDVLLGELGADYAGTQQGRLRGQEFGFREDIANPETPMENRQYAAQAVAGRPQNFLDSMGQGQYVDIRDEDPEVQSGALGDVITDAYTALAEQRRRPSSSTGEPLVRAIGPDGQPVYVVRSEAAGMTPAPSGRTPADTAEHALAEVAAEEAYYEALQRGDQNAAASALKVLREQYGREPGDQGGDEELPPGSRLVGHTASGAEVYETPDGRRLVAD